MYLCPPFPSGRTNGCSNWKISSPSPTLFPGTFATNQCQNSANDLKRNKNNVRKAKVNPYYEYKKI